MIYQNDADEQGFKTFCTVTAIKNHFLLDSYDYFRYNGKVTAKYDNFITKKDKLLYIKLSKNPDQFNVILANLVKNPKMWIGDIADSRVGGKEYVSWKSRNDNLSETFEKEIAKMVPLKDNFRCVNGGIPNILKQAIRADVSLETFSIAMHVSNVESYWNNNISDKIIVPPFLKKAKNYYPFLNVEEKVFYAILDSYM